MTLTEFLLARIAEDEAAAPRLISFLRYNPARVLAECEAKRRIVERSAILLESRGNERAAERAATRWTLYDLAAIYDDHPDFREDWMP